MCVFLTLSHITPFYLLPPVDIRLSMVDIVLSQSRTHLQVDSTKKQTRQTETAELTTRSTIKTYHVSGT